MSSEPTPRNFLVRFLEQLRTSQLLMLLTGMLAIDLVVPDPLPFVDEIVLGLVTLLVARWKMRSAGALPPPPQPPVEPDPPLKNVTPDGER